MATDLGRIVASLGGFYDFGGKTLVAVGAGGGQLIEYARPARAVVAVDKDETAIRRLEARAGERGLSDRLTLVTADFLETRPSGDVVLFEFCLHQMPEPRRALDHARRLARDVLVLDHAPGSRWSWCAEEDRLVEAAWKAVAEATVRRLQDVDATQEFRDFAELEARLSAQGPVSRERIAPYRGRTPIAIPMPYRLALL